MSNPVDDKGNVRVDFAWGNMPLQPNDQRVAGSGGSYGAYGSTEGADPNFDAEYARAGVAIPSNILDVKLDDHVRATGDFELGLRPGWNGYPGWEPNTIGDGDYEVFIETGPTTPVELSGVFDITRGFYFGNGQLYLRSSAEGLGFIDGGVSAMTNQLGMSNWNFNIRLWNRIAPNSLQTMGSYSATVSTTFGYPFAWRPMGQPQFDEWVGIRDGLLNLDPEEAVDIDRLIVNLDGRTIDVEFTLTSGPTPPTTLVTVPNFVGLNYATENVFDQIINLGLTVATVTENPVYQESLMSLVTSQSLSAGGQVLSGTPISLNRNQDFVSPLPDPVSWTWFNPEELTPELTFLALFSANGEKLAVGNFNSGWAYSIDGGSFTIWEPNNQSSNYYASPGEVASLAISRFSDSGDIVLNLNPGQTVQWRTSDGLLTPVVTMQPPSASHTYSGNDWGGASTGFFAGSGDERGELVLGFPINSLKERILARNSWELELTFAGGLGGLVSGTWTVVDETNSVSSRIRFPRPSNWDADLAGLFDMESYYFQNITVNSSSGVISIMLLR